MYIIYICAHRAMHEGKIILFGQQMPFPDQLAQYFIFFYSIHTIWDNHAGGGKVGLWPFSVDLEKYPQVRT